MHVSNSMIFLLFIATFPFLHGQLSTEELFFLNSKYTSVGNCSEFNYTFPNFGINYHQYNQLLFDCQSSSLIFRNTERVYSAFCPTDENYFEHFRLYLPDLSFASIRVNQFRLHGIELSSLDNFIQNTYQEYSYYRSQWALLINLHSQHVAIATNDEMTFILLIQSSELSITSSQNPTELIFPYENIFQFDRSSLNVWRIDQGFVDAPKSLENTTNYKLSKSEFTLFDNETFFLYGTETLYSRRIVVYIDQTLVKCIFDNILQCTFPILPLEIHDSHRPVLKVIYYLRQIFNTTLILKSRIRLDRVRTNHNLINIRTYQVNIDANLCASNSFKSSFNLVIHLQTENINGTKQYARIPKDGIGPIDCNTTAEIGREIDNLIQPISIRDITSLNVDLIHQWYQHTNCRAERTRITFN